MNLELRIMDKNFIDEPVEHITFKKPLIISADKLAAALSVLPVIDAENNPVGMIHITDLLRQGIF